MSQSPMAYYDDYKKRIGNNLNALRRMTKSEQWNRATSTYVKKSRQEATAEALPLVIEVTGLSESLAIEIIKEALKSAIFCENLSDLENTMYWYVDRERQKGEYKPWVYVVWREIAMGREYSRIREDLNEGRYTNITV